MDGNEKKHHEKLADWGERFALLVCGSLVIQQLVAPRTSVVVIGIGIIVTGAAYRFAYSALKKS